MAQRIEYKDLGLRNIQSVATYLLLENAYDSHLVSDISNVQYHIPNYGSMDLRPLDGLPMFVDDIYVYGYLSLDRVSTSIGGRIVCTTGEEGYARIVVREIQLCNEKCFGKNLYTKFVHTISLRIEESSIVDNVRKIENRRPLQNTTDKPAYVFVCKIDVSEIPIEDLVENIEFYKKELSKHGYGLYSVDYTQDFAGTLDRETLVDHLVDIHNFRKQGDRATCSEYTILENTSHVGNNTCTYIAHTEEGFFRTKFYNKVVANLEAGEVQNKFGSFLSNYANCRNKHLRKTFEHPLVQKHGCTRIEVSVYGATTIRNNTDTIQEVLRFVRGEELFVSKPPVEQYNQLVENIDQCCMVVDHIHRDVRMAWFAHTRTKRIGGVYVRPRDKSATMEKTALWTMGEFGFSNCPIYRIDIEPSEPDGILVRPLRAYTKSTPTILVPYNTPGYVPKPEDVQTPLETILPPTKHVRFVWRTKKLSNAIGKNVPIIATYPIETDKQISSLAKKRRLEQIQTIQDERDAAEWKDSVCIQRHTEETEKDIERCGDILREIVESKRREKDILDLLEIAFRSCYTKKMVEMLCGKYYVYGYRKATFSYRAILVDEKMKKWYPVWTNKRLEEIVEAIPGENTLPHETRWYTNPLEIDLLSRKVFFVDKKEICYVPVVVHRKLDKELYPNRIADPYSEIPDYLRRDILDEDRDIENLYGLQQERAPKEKEATKTIDVSPGEYNCYRYAKALCRQKERTYIYLQMEGKEVPVYGYFLQKEIDRIESLEKIRRPMLVRIGDIRTTKTKNKDRIAILAYDEEGGR